MSAMILAVAVIATLLVLQKTRKARKPVRLRSVSRPLRGRRLG